MNGGAVNHSQGPPQIEGKGIRYPPRHAGHGPSLQPPNGGMGVPGASGPDMAIANCANCSTTLTYPKRSLYIQCPKCAHTMNPQAPNTNYINCVGCTTLLSHPPSSLTIQCPKCLMIMELPVRGAHVPDDTPLSGKARKRRKDPNAPRRASNAYMIFCKNRRAQLKEERPDLAFGKLGAKLGEMWREMTPEDRKPYEAKAALDRDRFKREMETYNSELEERRKKSRIEGNADPNDMKPQRPGAVPNMMPNGSMPQVQHHNKYGGPPVHNRMAMGQDMRQNHPQSLGQPMQQPGMRRMPMHMVPQSHQPPSRRTMPQAHSSHSQQHAQMQMHGIKGGIQGQHRMSPQKMTARRLIPMNQMPPESTGPMSQQESFPSGGQPVTHSMAQSNVGAGRPRGKVPGTFQHTMMNPMDQQPPQGYGVQRQMVPPHAGGIPEPQGVPMQQRSSMGHQQLQADSKKGLNIRQPYSNHPVNTPSSEPSQQLQQPKNIPSQSFPPKANNQKKSNGNGIPQVGHTSANEINQAQAHNQDNATPSTKQSIGVEPQQAPQN